ncbi:hypothetical protein AAHA92_05078 [Salvia divinorum]|uniref:RNase H type-1 domain-containing protein n=1 Tax=Salvia divinorum TaxID=28513 RepID=A0ABD1I194_SALDI
MACAYGFNPTIVVSSFCPPIPFIAIRPVLSYPLIKEYDTCPESLNGFKYKVMAKIVLNDGEELMSLSDLCHALHSIWRPSLTWRVIPAGTQGFYSLQFSSYRDLVKVASAPSYTLQCGLITIVHDQLDANTTGPAATLVRWHRPPPSWLKVNTDGSSFGTSSSCGGIFRDHRGKVMASFSTQLGEGTAFEAELAACINALDIASDRGWRKLWLESDCTRVVELLYSRSKDVPKKYEGTWMRVLDRLQHMEFRVTHIYREGNRVADALASPNVQTELVSELLYQDTIGCVNLRLR